MKTRFPGGRSFLLLWLSIAAPAWAEDTQTAAPTEALERPDGSRIVGTLAEKSGAGLWFSPKDGGAPSSLEPGSVVVFDGPDPDPIAAPPPFRLELGLDRRLSGRLIKVDETTVTLGDSAAGGTITVARPGVHGVVQRAGEVQALRDGFESLVSARWSLTGEPEIVADPKLEKEHSLRIPAGGASLTYRLGEPIGSGRLEIAFHDTGATAPGQQWFVDLHFRGLSGPETVRAVLGWADESLAVETPGGPGLAVQRLSRKPGWHRLSVRFGPGETEIVVDGNDLAHGKGPGGPLVELRLASYSTAKSDPPPGLAGHLDDLRLLRFSQPTSGLECDITQDEVRLESGDQVFGTIASADEERVAFRAGGKEIRLPWSEVSGLFFRRVARQGAPVEGLLARLEWQSAHGHDARDLDLAEGALIGLTATHATLATPYAGTLTIPRNRLRKLFVLGRGRRVVIDPTAHHLGNDIVAKPPALDPPNPEGATLERPVDLGASVPPGKASVVLDVVQVAGESSGLPFATRLREGDLRTSVLVNGQAIDYINRHITTKNETPERIRLEIPEGLLTPGVNRVRIEQAGTKADPTYLDDLGVLEIALEFNTPRPVNTP